MMTPGLDIRRRRKWQAADAGYTSFSDATTMDEVIAYYANLLEADAETNARHFIEALFG